MTKKYIDAEKLERHFERCIDEVINTNGVTEDFEIALKATKNQPAEDVQEVRRGKWEDKGICHNYPKDGVNKYHLLICSKCGCMHRTRTHESGVFINASYCPNCGARMDGETNDS